MAQLTPINRWNYFFFFFKRWRQLAESIFSSTLLNFHMIALAEGLAEVWPFYLLKFVIKIHINCYYQG